MKYASTWDAFFKSIFIEQVDAYIEVWSKRLLPRLANIEEEAKEVEQKAFIRFSKTLNPELVEPDAIAEKAWEEGFDYYITMHRVRQGLLNMLTVGLYHLFEQQVGTFCQGVGPSKLKPKPKATKQKPKSKTATPSAANIEMLKVWLLNARAIDIEKFAAWKRLDELRDTANCAKHAEGKSCAKLRKKRPDLFIDPTGVPPLLPYPQTVTQPLFGEDLYTSEKHATEFAVSIKEFWTELGQIF